MERRLARPSQGLAPSSLPRSSPRWANDSDALTATIR